MNNLGGVTEPVFIAVSLLAFHLTLKISGGETPVEFSKHLCSRQLDLDVGLPLSQQPSSALIKLTLASPVLVVFSTRIEPSPAKTSLPFSPASTKTTEIL